METRDINQNLHNFSQKLLEYIQNWSKNSTSLPENNHWFNSTALELFSLQFYKNETYRQWCEGRSLSPDKVRAWYDIPAIPISAFKQFRLTCLEEHEILHYFLSSGTTGMQRSHHFHSKPSLEVYQKSLVAGFEKLFLSGSLSGWNGIVFSMIPPSEQAPHSSLAHMVTTLENSGLVSNQESIHYLSSVDSFGYWKISKENIHRLVKNNLDENIPVLILGTAFSFVHLFDYLKENNDCLSLPAGSLVMETGGYKGQSREVSRTQLHKMIEESLNVGPQQIITEYGMSELSSQAYRTPGSPPNPYICPPWMRVRIINPETGRNCSLGESGVMQIFDLANIWSVCAIETEDIGSLWHNGFEVIGRSQFSTPKGCSLSETGLSSPPNS